MTTTTKKLIGLAAFFAMFAFGSCEGLSPTVNVPFTSESEFELLPAAGKTTKSTAAVLLNSWDFNQSLETIIAEYGGDPEQIKESNIKSVTVTFAEDQDIDLSSIFTSLQLKVDKNPAVEEELVAEAVEIGATSITFNLVKTDIFDYTSSESGFTFLLYGDVNYANFGSIIKLKAIVESQLVVSIL